MYSIMLGLFTFYIGGYIIYNYPMRFYVYRNKNIKKLQKYTIDYFVKKHKKQKCLVVYSPNGTHDYDTHCVIITLEDYVNNYLKKGLYNYYLKTEDEYNLLGMMGEEQNMKTIMKQQFSYRYVYDSQLSFFIGAKHSTTDFHTDKEDIQIIYVIQGTKKINLASPFEDYNMYARHPYNNYGLYSDIDMKNIDFERFPKFKNVKIKEVILHAGDALLIPRNWWHSVENMEDSVAITYRIYRPWYKIFIEYPEIVYNFIFNKKEPPLQKELEQYLQLNHKH